MKRDPDLVRALLIAIEKDEYGYGITEFEGEWRQDQINYHLTLMKQHGLVSGDDGGPHGQFVNPNMTWAGHEFLDNIRNDTVWNKTKEFAKEKGMSAAISILVEVAAGYTKAMLGTLH